MPALVVITALPMEARRLRGLAPGEIRVVVAGVGADRAAAGALAALREGCRALVSWGSAAGLAPGLAPGAVVVGACSVSKTVVPSDGGLSACLQRRLHPAVGSRLGPIADAPAVLADPAEKAHLFERSGALVADMETAAIAGVARRAGVPWGAIRVVCDDAAMTVPSVVRHAVTEGRLDGVRLARGLVHAPAQLGSVCRVAAAFRRTDASFRQVVEALGW